jgi:uncharacterized membrane protein YhhN
VLPFVILTAVAVPVLLVAEARSSTAIAGLAKGVASSAFVAAAVAVGALSTPYGRAVLVALALSWAGDLLLLSRAERLFLAGLGAFLAAHLAYVVAFVLWGIDGQSLALALLPVTVLALVVARWLLPHVGARMRAPVVAYMVALSTMVALAAGASTWGAGTPLMLGAAVAFLVSDVSVARDRFVSPGLVNQVWGLPLYYGAQLAFAATTTMAATPPWVPR